MGASGSMNYSLPSGSFYAPGEMLEYKKKTINTGLATRRDDQPFQAASTTIITPGTLTVKYFQRVYDIDNTQWCYYTQTAINASPGTTDTQPNNSGNIISASVVQILEIY